MKKTGAVGRDLEISEAPVRQKEAAKKGGALAEVERL